MKNCTLKLLPQNVEIKYFKKEKKKRKHMISFGEQRNMMQSTNGVPEQNAFMIINIQGKIIQDTVVVTVSVKIILHTDITF